MSENLAVPQSSMETPALSALNLQPSSALSERFIYLDQDEYPLMAMRPIQQQQLSPFRELYTQGVRTLQVDATFSEDIFHPELRAWKAPDVYDYSYQAAYWEKILSVCPEVKFCLRLYCASPPWWDEQHPDELQTYADGTKGAILQRSNRETVPSLASELWREAASQALTRFLRWLESSGWSERIWGLFLCYGITWEWGILGTDRFPDYSEPMRREFRRWLEKTYTRVEDLRSAWGETEVTFATAEIPLLDQRLAGDGDFRVFPRDRAAADFQNCLSDTNCDYLLSLARTVREEAGQRYRLGAFYGYTLTSREHNPFTTQYGPGGLAGGHHAFGKFLRSGLFDFNSSPYAYADRSLGAGSLIQHFPRASCQLHGVHVYDENDLRTFLVAGMEDDRLISIGQTSTFEESRNHQAWALAQALCHGTSYWWTELSDWIGPYQPYYDEPRLLAELQRHINTFSIHSAHSKPDSSQIAIIVDERSIAALALKSKLFKREIYDQLGAWSWCGAPFDIWLAEDVNAETMKGVRLAYIFAPSPSREVADSLRRTLCTEGRTVWWTSWREVGNTSRVTRKSFANWTSLQGPCAGLPPEALGKIAQRAGVHLYGTAPLHVMRGGYFLAFQSAQDETRALALTGRWANVFTGEEINPRRVVLPRHETLLLRPVAEPAVPDYSTSA